MNPPKCYTWLESYGSPLSDGKKKKYFLNPISRQNFAYAFAETPNLNLEVRRRQLLGDVIASKINFYRFIVFSYNETTNLKRLEFSNRILSYNSLVKTMIKCKVKPFAS